MGQAVCPSRLDPLALGPGPEALAPGPFLPIPTMRFLTLAIASGFGTGYAPVASGTVGCLVGIPLFILLEPLRHVSVPLYLLTIAAGVAAACWIAGLAEGFLGEHDSGKIVIDEIVGYLAATLFLAPTAANIIVAFVIFRVLDVVKPYPANAIDARLPGGPGVVLDDVVSGLYTCLIMHALHYVGLLG